MSSWSTATYFRLVDDIVVIQSRKMYELDRGGSVIRRATPGVTGPRGDQDRSRPEALAPGFDQVERSILNDAMLGRTYRRAHEFFDADEIIDEPRGSYEKLGHRPTT